MSKKCRIHCDVHIPGKRREYEISSDMKVWPCCYFANGHQLKEDPDFQTARLLEEDQVYAAKVKEDPDWNDLTKHDLDDIVTDKFFTEYIFTKGWESDNPPPICVEECSVYVDELTGNETTKSRLD